MKRLDTIYIGCDVREQVAVDVLVESIHRHASRPLNVVALNTLSLRRIGLYRRTPDVASTCWGNPQIQTMVDAFDRKPFSTDFSFSRFLVPFLNQLDGFALFMDCDMFFRADPCGLFDRFGDVSGPAVWCVHHEYAGDAPTKMYGCPQQSYSRKNWSSFVLYNCGHVANERLTVDDVNTKPGRWLHNFQWLPDEQIGALPEKWNWLDGHSDAAIEPANVHFTSGGPWFDGWKPKRSIDEKYVGEWRESLRALPRSRG